MAPLKTCTLIGSDKGGVGKSLFAQLLVMAHDQGQHPLSVIEIDHQRKLRSILKDRVDLSLDAAPSIASSAKDRLAGETFFNRVYEMWAKGDCLTDLGANVTTLLMEWARVNDAAGLASEDGVHFRFVAVATPDDQSIRSAAVALQDARRSLGTDAELHLVLNDNSPGSGFAPYETTADWQHLLGLQESHGVNVIRVPFLDSVIMDWARALGFTVLDLLRIKDDDFARIQSHAKLDRLTLRTHMRRITDWIRVLQVEFQPLFVPHQASYRQAAE